MWLQPFQDDVSSPHLVHLDGDLLPLLRARIMRARIVAVDGGVFDEFWSRMVFGIIVAVLHGAPKCLWRR